MSEAPSFKSSINKTMGGRRLKEAEVDEDFAWFLNNRNEANERTEPFTKEAVAEDEDLDDQDPQYSLFLNNLTVNGKSYMLKISKNDESPRFLKYHEEDSFDEYAPPTHTNTSTRENRDNVNMPEDTRANPSNQKTGDLTNKSSPRGKRKIVSRQKKTEKRESTKGMDPCYKWFLDNFKNTEDGEFRYKGQQVNYEEMATSSDSEMLIWDNTRDCGEVNKNQLGSAEKDPSLKKELMCILRRPYDTEEYEELLEYVELKRPVCRLLPLRDRAISSAMEGLEKSVLDDVPGFRKKLVAARNKRSEALNLLRMFRFWLEHVPDERAFKPWLDQDCLNVRPSVTLATKM